MKCVYINLDDQTDRRNSIENSFAIAKSGGWTLQRFPAVTAASARQSHIAGTLRDAEKACFLSHKRVIETEVGAAPVLILEDDAIFGRYTAQVIDAYLARFPNPWDIIFTDVILPAPATIFELIKGRNEIKSLDQIALINLRELMPFAGSTAYIIHPAARGKILDLIGKEQVLNTPYDLFLRRLVHERKIEAYVFFPFVTSISPLADSSIVQAAMDGSPDIVWNMIRRLTWLERDFAQNMEALAEIDRVYSDDASRVFGTLFAALLSPKSETSEMIGERGEARPPQSAKPARANMRRLLDSFERLRSAHYFGGVLSIK